VEDAIMEEELPADGENKGEQLINGDPKNISCSPIADSDQNVPSQKSLDAPPFDSFLVLEVCFLYLHGLVSIEVGAALDF
jgi:DNA replication ATP-dependent helicase Dna2